MRWSVVDDPEFFLNGKDGFVQCTQIIRTTYAISYELMRKAKSKKHLLSVCQSETMLNHLYTINLNINHSRKLIGKGPSGVPLRCMAGAKELYDKGFYMPFKLIFLRTRECRFIKHKLSRYCDVPHDWDYQTFEFLTEVGLGIEDDGRDTYEPHAAPHNSISNYLSNGGYL